MTTDQRPKTLSRYWLLLGVVALAVAGLYSLTLVIGRAPVLSNNPEIQRIFKDALVVHVDLSVLVWFLAIACLFWSMATAHARSILPLEQGALTCFALTILFMMLSPFDPKAEALMSNYIPVISSPIFLMALGFLLCGVGFMLVKIFTSSLAGFDGPVRFGILSAGWITLISIACFLWSYRLMPQVFEGVQYFEMLFWGGGHVLQLVHVQIVMLCWLLVAQALFHIFQIPPRHLYILFAIGLLSACAAPVAYLLYDLESAPFRQFFTSLMIAANGVAPTVLALWILPGLLSLRSLRHGDKRALWSALLMSILLFLYGNILGAYIHGQNVLIPAHYHGSIVGITIGFMAFAYVMLPRFGYREVTGWRMAYWQPILYGAGQVMHVSGLAYSGGYGVLRKTAGGVDALAPNIKIALGFMGLGGLLAIIGGLLFVVVVYRSIRR
ncbi:MAG: cbb3-type cytochrome c oxidase subunit I [Alphaproteobacteria bacterium]|nr:cbb3-type cytochrome c oxidase subunit I [Alphaproteobacteria bacterium]